MRLFTGHFKGDRTSWRRERFFTVLHREAVGQGAFLRGIEAFKQEAREAGFKTLQIEATRISGANPFRFIDMLIDLTK